MNRSLEWRLARTFCRCYSLVLILSLVQASFGPLFALLMTSDGFGQREMWTLRVVLIFTLVAWLGAVAVLWFYSDKIADRLAGTGERWFEDERRDFPFDVAVGLAGVIFLVQGLKGSASEAAAWYFSKHMMATPGQLSDSLPYRPQGIVNVRFLAASVAETIIGLVLFVGARSLVQGIMKLRGMPQSTEDEEAADDQSNIEQRSSQGENLVGQ